MLNKPTIIMKQFKNLILAGALVLGLAGFAVSCDKYGDDIDELRDKVNTLASKDELSSQIASLQSALSAASAEASQASAEAATAKAAADKAAADAKSAGDAAAAAAAEANAAKAAADKAAADAKQAAIEALQSELETLKADLKEATDAQLADFEKKVNAATEKVEALIGKVAGMVTSVELVTSFTANPSWTTTNTVLKFSTANEQDNVFEEDIANAITFKKGNQVQTPTAFIVRVSPTNAALTPEMISLVNSQGKNLDDMVTIKSVKKFSGLLTRAAENSGLWEVEVELTKYDKDEFAAASKTKDKSILYAVQVNNTPTAEETASRYVTSSYDLTLDWTEYEPVDELNYFVNDKNIKDINNRYAPKDASGNPNKSLKQDVASGVLAPEYKWKNEAAVVPVTKGANINVDDDKSDDRSGKDVYPAVQGEDIVISLTKNVDKIEAPENIRAMYVTLDYKKNAVESAPSEWNAWNSYKYTGLNSVVEGTEVTITINPGEGQTIIDDYIGFRVYAVNYDGTLVDPDGKAFYVKVGNAGEEWSGVNTVIVPGATLENTPNSAKSADVAVTLTKLDAPDHATWLDEKGEEPIFDAYFVAGSATYNTTASGRNNISVDFTKVTKIYTKPRYDGTAGKTWADIKDGKAYNGTLTIYNADGFVLTTINISMTKQLPTAPEGFSVKTNQQEETSGVYNCYLIPSKDGSTELWAATQAKYGLMSMNDVFNWGDGEKAQYVISFAKAKNNGKDAIEVAGDENLVVADDYIDNTTQHATTVYYNYGMISSETKDASGNIIDYKVAVTTFPTVFNCIYNDTYTWHWGTAEEVKEKYTTAGWTGKNAPITELEYGSDYTFTTPKGTAYSFDAVILGVSSRDGKYSAWLNEPYGGNPYNSSLELDLTNTHVISKGNGVEDEYFKVKKDSGNRLYFKATAISENSNPTDKVPSTLKLVYKDMYEHDVVIELDMTVVPR